MHVRTILDRLAESHRAAHAELRDGMAALDRVNGRKTVRDEIEPRRTIVIQEFPESPDTAWDWRAQFQGDEDPAHWGWGCTPRQALADLTYLEKKWLAEGTARNAPAGT